MENVTSWKWLRSFVKEQEAVDLDKLSRGALMAMQDRLHGVIMAQYLPPLFTFFRLCNLHDSICNRIMATSVDYHAARQS